MNSGQTAPGVAAPSPVEEALELMTEMTGILGEELRLVKGRNASALQNLMRRKTALVVRYQACLKTIAANPDLVRDAPAGVLARLRATGLRLNDAAQGNAVVLSAAVGATRRVVEHIIRMVKEEVLPQHGYADPRTAHLELGSYSPTCPPVAFNRIA